MTIFGKKQVLMKGLFPPQTGQPPKEKFFTLSEGERDGELEVVEINAKNETVKVINFGTPQTLDFTNDGPASLKPPPGPAPGIAMPGAILPPRAPGAVNPAQRSIPLPLRPVRPTSTDSAAVPNATVQGAPMTAGVGTTPSQILAGGKVVPNFSAGGYANNMFPNGPPVAVDRDQQAILIEAQRATDPEFPPMPPTHLSDELNQEATPPASTPPATTTPEPNLPGMPQKPF